ncbi:CBS domain-containing protein [Roseovarius sp. D22-M7]|uniref:CBS domain-containing protein n=1 Tax=Roseovarius sp. D22-M7 TaxID=3127116 RepID=UPI0030101269
MLVRKVMSSPVIGAMTTTTIIEAAESMRLHKVGALPVFNTTLLERLVRRSTDTGGGAGTIVVGIVTDRDIVTRGLTLPCSGFDPQMEVASIMSHGVVTCYENQDVLEAAGRMGEHRIRRLLVLDISGSPVGILSLGDIAEHVSEALAGQVLGEVTELRARDAPVHPANARHRHGVS